MRMALPHELIAVKGHTNAMLAGSRGLLLPEGRWSGGTVEVQKRSDGEEACMHEPLRHRPVCPSVRPSVRPSTASLHFLSGAYCLFRSLRPRVASLLLACLRLESGRTAPPRAGSIPAAHLRGCEGIPCPSSFADLLPQGAPAPLVGATPVLCDEALVAVSLLLSFSLHFFRTWVRRASHTYGREHAELPPSLPAPPSLRAPQQRSAPAAAQV